ncbi:hypothetical protein JHK82_033928 [Glycine max]|nr:hypothetical protein JHK85_034638 [Glycine max]KAG4986317.1 hypothetical protein JHK86_034008 [Glycine max]KAG5119508.1 hypothetical protein JHK82_033928 [Glycine max]KAG5140499.1 hypothetical protein JHK84_034267 [Glycine max]
MGDDQPKHKIDPAPTIKLETYSTLTVEFGTNRRGRVDSTPSFNPKNGPAPTFQAHNRPGTCYKPRIYLANFFVGMTTTRSSESINSYIEKFLDVKTSLVDFVNQVGVAVNIRNQASEETRMCQRYHNPPIRTSFPIEDHVATILTPNAFELFQNEIDRKVCSATSHLRGKRSKKR